MTRQVGGPEGAEKLIDRQLLGEIDFPGRRGGFIRCNDWRFDLFDDEPAG